MNPGTVLVNKANALAVQFLEPVCDEACLVKRPALLHGTKSFSFHQHDAKEAWICTRLVPRKSFSETRLRPGGQVANKLPEHPRPECAVLLDLV